MTDIPTTLRDDAAEQMRTALQELSREAADVALTGSGIGLGRVRQALVVAEAWTSRFSALAEACSAIAEDQGGADPAADLPVEYTAAYAGAPGVAAHSEPARAGLRLITGGAEQGVQLPAAPGGVVTIPQHLATVLGVEPTEAPARTALVRPPGLSERAAAIGAIRTALRERSGKRWSVRGGRGTSYGQIIINAQEGRLDSNGNMTEADARELHALLAMGGAVPPGKVCVEPRRRLEFVARARGEHTAPYYPGTSPE